MGKRHEAGEGSRRSDPVRVRPDKKPGVLPRVGPAEVEMGSEVRSLRFYVVPFGFARANEKGYPRLWAGKWRGQYLHRAVWEKIAKRKIPKGFQVHHMNGKLCWCPHQLVALGPGLHVHEPIRHPYTGEFMTRDQYVREFGKDA